jgi:hypothetical protein
MHPTIRTTPLLLLLTVIGAIALPAATARADQLAATVTGFLDDGSDFNGAFRVNRFRSTRLGVFASGLLVGTVTNRDGDLTDVLSIRVTVPVADIRSTSTSPGNVNCDFLQFAMDGINVRLVSVTLHTDPFDLGLKRDSVNAFGSQFCAIADGFANGRFTAITSSLNILLDTLAIR